MTIDAKQIFDLHNIMWIVFLSKGEYPTTLKMWIVFLLFFIEANRYKAYRSYYKGGENEVQGEWKWDHNGGLSNNLLALRLSPFSR